MGLCKTGASVREICITADKRIEEETGKAFKKDKNIQKGKIILWKFSESLGLKSVFL